VLSVRIAGTAFQVTTAAEDIDWFRRFYGGLVVSGDADERFAWRGTDLINEQTGETVATVSLPEHRRLVTTIALQKRALERDPALSAIHGNAICIGSRTVLLIGPSGSGKSTQSMALLDSPDAALLAEDVIWIDQRQRVIIPYPRAASVVGPDGEERFQPPDRVCTFPRPTESVSDVFLLGEADPMEQKGSGFIFVTSRKPGRLPDGAVLRAGADGFPRVFFPSRPSDEVISDLEHQASADGALILWAGPVIDAGRREKFPAEPRIAAADAAAFLKHIHHEIISVASQDGRRSNKRTFDILGLFSGAACWRLQPGGGAELTARAISRILAEERP
jgi:ABC-type dipeptide/oligopeptide/nickel transport system ATPase component